MTQPAFRLPLIHQVLEEQSRLTVVERFAQRHAAKEPLAQREHYRALIPLTEPAPGQQYGFHVDLDKCTGCKACVAACHRVNGLDDGESWRSVGLLHGGTVNEPVQKTVTAACHHCLDPACMKGCPVDAYEKDPLTGIVRHLDDQCIGCQYCMLTCPYEVPQFNERLGIVRKCDMCADRLAVGEAPACVQGCPNEAIEIRLVDREQVVADTLADAFLPGAPSPGITAPTTTYQTDKPLPRNVLPADFHDVRPAAQHMSLVVMLVLTQLSVGAFAADAALHAFDTDGSLTAFLPLQSLVALGSGLLALGASVFHLGRPALAYRALLGIRTSWLSREILAFGVFAALAFAYAASYWLNGSLGQLVRPWQPLLAASVVLAGGSAIACSAFLYHATHRRFWHISATGFRFFMTAGALGLATTLWVAVVPAEALGVAHSTSSDARRVLAWALALASGLKLVHEAGVFAHLTDRQHGDLKRSAILMTRQLWPTTKLRFLAGTVGGVLVPMLCASTGALDAPGKPTAFFVTAGLAAVVAGEILERRLFFAAVSAPRMPGAVGGQGP